MNYLWQESGWPDFTYDSSKTPADVLYQYSQAIGRLSLNLEKTPEDLRVDAVLDLMVKEAVTTSAIEVVSGPPNKQRVHFEGPPAENVPQEMARFFDWYNQTNPINLPADKAAIIGPVRAAIAHLWFVTIHPFDDGNGRIARALCDHALSQDVRYPMLHSLSAAIDPNPSDYYDQLEQVQSQELAIGDWINWFVGITCESVIITQDIIAFTLDKARFIKLHRGILNERQLQVVLLQRK